MDVEILKTIAEDALESLKCPVCMECMEPPIVMCEQGHSICNPCYEKCSHCPCCRSMFVAVRNMALTYLVEKIPTPCPNASWGCTEFFKISERKYHSVFCRFRHFYCKDSKNKCSWNGTLEEFKEHCGQRSHISISRRSAWLVPVPFISKEYACLTALAYDELFLFKQNYDAETKSYNWGLQLIGSPMRAAGFVYQVIIGGLRTDKNVTFTHMCESIYMEDSELFKDENSINVSVDCILTISNCIRMKLLIMHNKSFNKFRRTVRDEGVVFYCQDDSGKIFE